MPKIKTALEGMQFGADPELFVINPAGDFVSAHGMIPGTKEEPFKVEGGAVQVDGVAAEFNIDPVTNYKDFKRNITEVRRQLQEMLPNGHTLVCTPTASFTEEEWEKVPDASKVLGCSPDFNAWSRTVNPPPVGIEGIRHAGGHVHIGWTEGADTDDKGYVRACVDLVRQLDWYLGLWSVKQDTDHMRRSAYGQAGAMRFKPYGVEYRTLSNFWLRDEDTMLHMWNRLQEGINKMKEQFFPVLFTSYNKSMIEAINTSDYDNIVFSEFSYPISKV